MSDLKKAIDTQQRINEAAKDIIDYFRKEVSYVTHLETAISAQAQIIGLMELAKIHMITDPNDELDFQTDNIGMFLRFHDLYLTFLKRFVLIGEDMEGGKVRYE